MRFGIFNLVPAEAPFEEWLRFTRAVEEAGFAHVTVGDVQTRSIECTVNLTLLATNTTRARIGPTISNPLTRHPGVAASTYASLQKLSGGRAFFGIGTGNSAVRNLGLRPARLDRLEAYIRTFRELIAHGESHHEGLRCVLPWAPAVAPEGVPVYVAANGPRSLRLAGRIADGVIAGGGVTPDVVELTLTYLDEGARSAGRCLDDLDIWFQADVLVTETDDAATEQMKDILASIASRNFRHTFDGKAVPDELQPAIRAFEHEYEYAEHISRRDHNGEILDRCGLTRFFADRFLVGGTRETVIRRLETLERHGVHQLHVPGLVPDPFGLVEEIRDHLMPRLATPTGSTAVVGGRSSE